MTVLVFLLVLIALIVVHELGHFAAAKLAGMRVDEFGVGYPPRAATLWKKGDTEYTLNWLPFGGFVKIYGEDGEEGKKAGEQESKNVGAAFGDKNRFVQALVLVAGILMNLVFAYLLISVSFWMGAPRALSAEEARTAPDAALTIATVLPGSPADEAGLKEGDVVKQALAGDEAFRGTDADAFTDFVGAEGETPISFDLLRGKDELLISVKPRAGVIAADASRPAIGVAVAAVGSAPEPFLAAFSDGFLVTLELTKETAVGLAQFFAGIFTLHADLADVAGPVGIAGAVGTAAKTGLAALLSLTAVISVNLALINLLPVPALDGGRLLFVLIEALTRRPIKPAVANAVNGIGFLALVLLMVAVTAHDLFRIVA
jgi:regulator of sigma E protease